MGLRFGLIGCGWIVERDHTPAMLRSDNVSIVATANVSAERARLAGRLAGLDDHACLTDYRAVLDRDDVDVVSVTSLSTTRLQVVRDAAAAGKHDRSAFRSFGPDCRRTPEIAHAACLAVGTALPAELPLTADQAIYSDGPIAFLLPRKEHASVG